MTVHNETVSGVVGRNSHADPVAHREHFGQVGLDEEILEDLTAFQDLCNLLAINDQPRRRSADCGSEFAWASIAVPDCTRML